MPSPDITRSALLSWLRERACAIATCEQSADIALYEHKDEPAYREWMEKKASLLASIATDVPAFANILPAQDEERLTSALASFSRNAGMALRLGSVFYMSALLYPDDHRKGEPNNLERLITSLQDEA